MLHRHDSLSTRVTGDMVRRPTIWIILLAALWMCVMAAPGQARHTTHTHVSPAAPLGGVNIPAIYAGASLAGIDQEIQLAHGLHAKVVRLEVPWSALEPLGAGQIDAGTLAAADRLV